MKSSPTKTMEYLNNVLIPWKELAPDETISDLKVADFETEINKSVNIRVKIANGEAEITNDKQLRDTIDETNYQLAQRIVSAVAGHPKFGKDSGLYDAMGFVTKSARKSGLTRKKKTPTP